MTISAEDTENQDKEKLLALLQAHGQNFMSSFGSLPRPTTQPRAKRKKLDDEVMVQTVEKSEDGESTGDEWTGFGSEGGDGSYLDESDGMSDGVEDAQDDEFRSYQFSKKQPQVVVFSAPSSSDLPKVSKLQAKSFMSSKVSKIREEASDARDTKEIDVSEGDFEEERSNVQNDALLHKLVHTQLLSDSLNSELDLTPAQRRKALEGRVLELAGQAKLGKGESLVKQEERKKASKIVRMGLERKVEERRSEALEQAKNLGNYHRSIKHLFLDDSKPKERKKRDRGLKLGVGRFSGGVLKLGKDDIASLQGGERPQSKRGGFRGRR